MEANLDERFKPLRDRLAELQKESDGQEFDIETPEGNKAARSYVYKLRQARAAVETERKAEKAEALEYGRRVDSQAKLIMEAFTKMIDRHWGPIQAIEDAEAKRIADNQEALEQLRELGTLSNEPVTLEQLRLRLTRLVGTTLIEWDEFVAEATKVRDQGIATIKAEIKRLEKYEAEQAELAELRKMQDEQDRKAREEADAKRTEVEAQRREQAAAQEVRDAHAREEERQRQRDEEEAIIEAARQADVEHRGQVFSDVQDALRKFLEEAACDAAEELCFELTELIDSGKVPHVSIAY